MAARLWLFLFLLSVCAVALAQAPVAISDSVLVQDSAGTIYPYPQWKKKVSSWKYGLVPFDRAKPDSGYLIRRLTEKEQQAMNESRKPRESSAFKTGERLKKFRVKTIDNKVIDLEDLRGKIVVLNFWFIMCPPCRQEMPELKELADDYRDSTRIVFLAFALDDSHSLREFLEKMPLGYQVIAESRFLADRYNIHNFPTNVVLDTEGRVYFHTMGYSRLTLPWMRKSIEDLFEGMQGDAGSATTRAGSGF